VFGVPFNVRGSGFGVRRSGFVFSILRSCGSRSNAQFANFYGPVSKHATNRVGTSPAVRGCVVAKTYQELRAWQTVRAFKVGIYALIEHPPLANDFALCDQLRKAASSAQSNIAEGFGRFDPPDFGRFVKVARASLLECRNHLSDAVDRRVIGESVVQEHEARLAEAMKEVGGLLDYLQSPEAKRNAERIRQRRIERRRVRSRNMKP
jgi:four helix bundle protein